MGDSWVSFVLVAAMVRDCISERLCHTKGLAISSQKCYNKNSTD